MSQYLRRQFSGQCHGEAWFPAFSVACHVVRYSSSSSRRRSWKMMKMCLCRQQQGLSSKLSPILPGPRKPRIKWGSRFPLEGAIWGHVAIKKHCKEQHWSPAKRLNRSRWWTGESCIRCGPDRTSSFDAARGDKMFKEMRCAFCSGRRRQRKISSNYFDVLSVFLFFVFTCPQPKRPWIRCTTCAMALPP